MKWIITLCSIMVLAACDSDGNDNRGAMSDASFEVVVRNLTVGQPLSPVAVVAHASQDQIFEVGQAASTALEVLAEGGDNSDLLSASLVQSAVSGASPLGPGQSETLMVELSGVDPNTMSLSVVSMLVNTNDAFTAINGIALAGMGVGESLQLNTVSYDSGTEANTENAATIPGPAGGGEGFNAARDDLRDQVTMHGGVVTAADGLGSSDLGQQHRWDNPVAAVTITRTR